MAQMIAGALPGRHIRVVADSAYAGGELKKLPAAVTWTTRLRKDAALNGLPPARAGRRGRPRTKGRPAPLPSRGPRPLNKARQPTKSKAGHPRQVPERRPQRRPGIHNGSGATG